MMMQLGGEQNGEPHGRELLQVNMDYNLDYNLDHNVLLAAGEAMDERNATRVAGQKKQKKKHGKQPGHHPSFPRPPHLPAFPRRIPQYDVGSMLIINHQGPALWIGTHAAGNDSDGGIGIALNRDTCGIEMVESSKHQDLWPASVTAFDIFSPT
jgi:hypothetical protein